jgi:hypothetical protein
MMTTCNRIHNIRKNCLYSILAVTPVGFGFKLYTGPAHWWFNDYGAGLLYEIFWILVVFLIGLRIPRPLGVVRGNRFYQIACSW